MMAIFFCIVSAIGSETFWSIMSQELDPKPRAEASTALYRPMRAGIPAGF